MAEVTLYNKSLPEGENVWAAPNEDVAAVMEKSGWSRDLPKKYQSDETKEA